MHYAGTVLAIHFRGRAFVATDLLVYYRKDDKGATVAPDFVLEVISSTTPENDAG